MYRASLMAQQVTNRPAMWETLEMQVQFLGQKDPLEGRKWQPTLVFLPRESHGQRSLAGYSPSSCKELDMTDNWHTHAYNVQHQECTKVNHWVITSQCRFINSTNVIAQPVKESACNAGDPGSIPGSGRSTGEGIGYPLQYSWASLVALLVKNLPAMWETWVRSLGQEDPLGKGKATYSSILAWRIPWTV